MQQLQREGIEFLITHFESGQLPKSEWTHQAHIIVAFWYNWHYSFAEALERVRQGIIAYNEAVGTPNTDDSGYHETLTVFWMRLARSFLQRNQPSSLENACTAFLESEDALKTSPFTYYSRELLFSKHARKEWVEGDLQEVPEVSD